MKIFIVCNSLGAGGAERVGVNLANGFVNHGHEVYIITDLFQEAAYPVDEKVTVLPMTKLKLLLKIHLLKKINHKLKTLSKKT